MQDERIKEVLGFIARWQKKIDDAVRDGVIPSVNSKLSYELRGNYCKIFYADDNMPEAWNRRSVVVAYVHLRTGDIYRPKTWTKSRPDLDPPRKGVSPQRGNINDKSGGMDCTTLFGVI